MNIAKYNAMGAASFFIHDCGALETRIEKVQTFAGFSLFGNMVYDGERPVGYFFEGNFYRLINNPLCDAIVTMLQFWGD